MIDWKMKFLSEMSPELIEEFVRFNSDLQEFMKEYYQKSYKCFLNYFITWQKNGEIRQSIRPEFFLAVLDKVQELSGDDNLKKLYRDHVEFAHELHNFFFYGIVSRISSEQK